jgi:preprotein translocase subunit SecE
MKKKEKKVKEKKIKKDGLFKKIRLEMKKVTWPSRKEVLKYSVATIIFCVIIMIFFQALDFVLSVIKGVFN